MVGRISAIPPSSGKRYFAAFGHASKCYWRKGLAHGLVSQIIMDGVDIGDLQADAAPAEHVTNWGDGCGVVLSTDHRSSSSTYRRRPFSRKHEARAQRFLS